MRGSPDKYAWTPAQKLTLVLILLVFPPIIAFRMRSAGPVPMMWKPPPAAATAYSDPVPDVPPPPRRAECAGIAPATDEDVRIVARNDTEARGYLAALTRFECRQID